MRALRCVPDMDYIEFEKRISNIRDENEKKVARFLQKLGFEFIECNLKVGDLEHQLLGEIDLIYKFQNYLFLVEVSKEGKANEKRFAFFIKWVDSDVLKWITKKYQLRSAKIIRIYFEMQAKKPTNFPSKLLQTMTKKGKMNMVVYSDRYEILEGILQKDSQNARNEFLEDVKQTEQDSFKESLKRYFDKS